MVRKSLAKSEDNSSSQPIIIILAAGKGTRMGGESPKVLVRAGSKTLISHVLNASIKLNPQKIVVVTGFKKKDVEEEVNNWVSDHRLKIEVEFAFQREQNGTGDAVKAALPKIKGHSGEVVILCGDAPLITSSTLQHFLESHSSSSSTVSVLTALITNPASYGRMVRDSQSGELRAIKEARDCNANELLINEINSGAYVVDSAFLTSAINNLSNNNAQGEYYLTDIVEAAQSEGQNICGILASSAQEVAGVNTPADL